MNLMRTISLMQLLNFRSHCSNSLFANAEEFRERFYVPFGSGGPSRYYYRAAELLRRQTPDFEPEGLREHLAGTNKAMKDECDRLVPWITDALHGHVVRMLRERYGGRLL